MNEITIITEISMSAKSRVSLAAVETYDFPVIVKELDNTNKDVYLQVQKLNSEYFPCIYECYDKDNRLIVIEEYIDGMNLKEYSLKHSFSLEEIQAIFWKICQAVQSLHECMPPIIHRDIKPSNILITKDGNIKIIDFDASREYRSAEQSEDTKKLGTIEYAPPEQFGYSQTDVRSDIYTMGVVLYELAYGKRFSRTEKEHDTKNNKCIRKIQAIIDKCTMFDPDNRYQNVKEIIAELDGLKINIRKRLYYRYIMGAVTLLTIILIRELYMTEELILSDDSNVEIIGENTVISPSVDIGKAEKNIMDVTITPSKEPVKEIEETNAEELTITPIPEMTSTPEVTSTPEISLSIIPTVIPIMNLEPTPTEIVKETKKEDNNETVDKDILESSTEYKLYDDNAIPHYYKNPEIKEELLLYMQMFEGKSLSYITCTLLGAEDRKVLSSTDYRYENNIIAISTNFLDTLSNFYYQLDASFSDGTNFRSLVLVHDEKDDYVPVRMSLLTSNYEFSIADQNQLHCVLQNENGKRIKSIKIGEDNIPKEYYKILYGGRALEIGKELFQLYSSKENVTVSLMMADNSISTIFIKLYDKTKKYPQTTQGEFSIDIANVSDLDIAVIWNDYPEMRYIHTLNKGDRIAEGYWYQSKNSIVIKKEYLEQMQPGVYKWVLEFGDVGLGINVTVYGG